MAQLIWTGAAGDRDWSNPLNWSTNQVPTSSDTVEFIPGVPNGPEIETNQNNMVAEQFFIRDGFAHNLGVPDNRTTLGWLMFEPGVKGSKFVHEGEGVANVLFGSVGADGTMAIIDGDANIQYLQEINSQHLTVFVRRGVVRLFRFANPVRFKWLIIGDGSTRPDVEGAVGAQAVIVNSGRLAVDFYKDPDVDLAFNRNTAYILVRPQGVIVWDTNQTCQRLEIHGRAEIENRYANLVDVYVGPGALFRMREGGTIGTLVYHDQSSLDIDRNNVTISSEIDLSGLR